MKFQAAYIGLTLAFGASITGLIAAWYWYRSSAVKVVPKPDGRGQSRLRHDQAIWCAEIFLRDWGALAAEFGWTRDDLFVQPTRRVWWLAADGTDCVRSLGPDCAVSEDGSRVFDRLKIEREVK